VVAPLKGVQVDVLETITAARLKAEKCAKYRAVYRIASNDVLAHWQIEERRFWFHRWLEFWEPVGICEKREEAQELVDRLEHDSPVWPRT
jgi:hypothetical protein